MNFKLINFLIACLIINTGCTKETKIIETSGPNNDPNGYRGGTDSVGGGNTINGKPIDAYIKDPKKLNCYINKINPLIEKLESSYPNLAADFKHFTLQRDWYFVPGSIEVIPKIILGTYSKTDQTALQDFRKVWIDYNLFSQMTEDDQAILIIHEFVIGMRLLTYNSKYDNCLATGARLLNQSDKDKANLDYRNESVFCRKTYFSLNDTTNFDLKSSDYDFVRKLVSKIVTDNIDISELKSLVEDTRFRNYEQ